MSDYSKPYTEEDKKWEKRRDNAIRRVRSLPARNVTVGEILDVINAIGKYHWDMGLNNVTTLEKIIGDTRKG